jgi:type IV pilus assembly protein PilW
MTHRPATRHTKPATQGGFSLVELMVSMVIGLVIVGAVFANYLTNKTGARQTEAMAQVTDDATTAFGILRSQIAMAGYSQPTSVNAAGEMVRANLGLAILGCEGGFGTGATTATDAATVTCATPQPSAGTNAANPDALIVRYQADMSNTPIVKDSVTNVDSPSDCQGSAITAVDTTAAVIVADNRFRVDTTAAELECSGSGDRPQGAQPLVQNIVNMQLHYGVAAATAPGVVNRYVRANDVAAAGAVGYEANWANVVAVRVCLVVRSTDAVLDAVTDYRDCNGTVTTPPDRRVYRAFTSTILLNNRSALPNLTATP